MIWSIAAISGLFVIGKGETGHWVAPIKKGRILLELEGVPPEAAREALRRAATKLPIKTRFIEREGVL